MKSNEISINGHKRREKIKFDKGLSIRQTCIKTRYTNLSNCLLRNLTFRLVTHSGCLHLSNTPLRARQKNRTIKITQRTLVPGVCTLWVLSDK